MTDATSTPLADPGPPPPRTPSREAGFFTWVRGLGIVRTRGWLGGVCAGIAARIGIDPLIVRGIFVVTALLGFPALLLYVIGWALLPGLDGRILVQELGRGRFDPTMIAVGILALVSFLPVASWAWSVLFWPVTGALSPTGVVGAIGFVPALVLGLGVVALVLWAISRSHRSSSSGGASAPGSPSAAAPGATADLASANPAASAAPGPADASGASMAGADAAAAPFGTAPAAASDIPSPASVDEWRSQHEQWRTQHDAWRRQQADADAAAREQARREREEQGRAFAAAAQAKAEWRRRTRPRTSALYVLGVLGAGLVGGAVTALSAAHVGVAIACASALLVCAIVGAAGMAVAGILHRRSGFLAFTTSALLAIGLMVGYLGVVQPGSWSMSLSTSAVPQSQVQAFGSTDISVVPLEHGGTAGVVDLRKGSGDTQILVQGGTRVALDATLGDGTVVYEVEPAAGGDVHSSRLQPTRRSADGDVYRWTYDNGIGGAAAKTLVPLQITQAHGDIYVVIMEEDR